MWKLTLQSEVIELDALSSVNRAVWVPTEALSFLDCKIAPKQRRLLRQMIPFALEDNLIDPIEQLHFAFNPVSDEHIPVLVVANRLMDEWQTALQDKGIKPKILLPDIYAVPFEDDKVTIWHENDRCLLRTAMHRGMAGTVEWIKTIVDSEGHQDNLIIYSDNPQALPQEWQEQALALSEPLDQRLQQFVILDAINLLQGEYALRSPLFSLLKVWRPVMLLTVLAVATHIGNMMFETNTMQKQIADLQKKKATLYKTLDKSAEAPTTRAQIQQYIRRIQAYDNTPRNDVWTILPRVDKVISKCRVCQVEKITLDDSALTIELRAVGEFSESKEALLDMKAIETEYELIKEDDNYTISRFKFKLIA